MILEPGSDNVEEKKRWDLIFYDFVCISLDGMLKGV
jgi:hypothetical protein